MWSYERIVGQVIRPQRTLYNPALALPGPVFDLEGQAFCRDDFEVFSTKGHRMKCSHFRPLSSPHAALPCVIYCHGNCGNRTEACDIVEALLPLNFTVIAFDWVGCGLSEGDYITLGGQETDDLATLVNHVVMNLGVRQVALWGRSMGAATCLRYCGMAGRRVAAVAADSSYTSVPALLQHIGSRHLQYNVLTKAIFSMLKKSVKSRTGVDLTDVDVLAAVGSDGVPPAVFGFAQSDDLVPPEHTCQLHAKYMSPFKQLVPCEGEHNSNHCAFVAAAADFLVRAVKPPPVQHLIRYDSSSASSCSDSSGGVPQLAPGS
eukprot:CAMPEP_0118938642 /NCGR_PEP_ID=MMETSP1169-20130426/26613_1 /TAXON_ID=36882 /ORGANISM="Pyramimonas obovata, Strain CCMP722" /LENGTH=317 /DNA_ID=CAMNT_0006882645 /DNA_START=269 /DNA_END=1219 /DNA_ORIENTATION=-